MIGYASEPVRVAAVRALGRIDDPSAATAIASALTDRDGSVRRCARHALIQLGAVEHVKSNPWRLLPLRLIDASRVRTVASHDSQG